MAQREQKGGLGAGLWALLLGLGVIFIVILVLGGVYIQARLSALPERDPPDILRVDPLEEMGRQRNPVQW
ncbi:MAG: hypothetical protein L0Z62_01675 [Gemmataceae bacterium]|nr:hypothetical protein [Gemmataceae bacterium]